MMKSKVLGLFAGIATICSVQAQTYDVKRDTVVLENTDRYKVETNRFFDNWFIGAGVGAQVYYGLNDNKQAYGDRITPVYNINLGKWFTPGVGVRVTGAISKGNGLTENNYNWYTAYYNNGNEITADGNTFYEQDIKYGHVSGQALFNLSNILGGYNNKRFYTIAPYAGLGYLWSRNQSDTHENELTGTAGILNTFRLSDAFGITLDVNGIMTNGRFSHKYDPDINKSGRRDYIASASLGLVYRFKQNTWEKPKTTIIKYNEAELQALRDRVNRLAADNDALRRQLANASDTSITNIQVEKKILAAPILVTFPINKSIVSNEARVNLGFFAKVIKEAGPNIVYAITGYADKGTGTPAINEKLSRDRAQAIYNVLVKEFGVAPAQLKTAHEGGVANMFYDDPRLSRAVIVIGE